MILYVNNINVYITSDRDKLIKMRNLPLFPLFRPFTIDDIDWYKKFYSKSKLNPYVDIHYTNLLTWLNINKNLQISRINRTTLVFKYINPLNKNQINIIPLSKSLTDKYVEEIFSYISKNSLEATVQEVPSIICTKLDNKKWEINSYRDGFEYILDLEEHVTLRGSKFEKQRNVISRFNRDNILNKIDIEYHDSIDDTIIKIFSDYISRNELNHHKNTKDNIFEAKVIKKNLDLAKLLNKKVLTISSNGRNIAIAMFCFLDDKTAAFNHLKVDYSINYIFDYAIHQLSLFLFKQGIKEMNIEQDLGIEAMRFHKEKLRPSRFLEKVTIRPRE